MEAVEETQVVWEGASVLRPFIVPIDSVEPFPGNPRRGDVEVVRGSLRRFGQTRPILTDASNGRVVAGHHVRLAAEAEGWTHVAVMPNEFKDEDEARAYLLTDNRTHDVGPGYDPELLVDNLRALAELDALEGTGYTPDDLDYHLAQLRQLHAVPPVDPLPPDPGPPSGADLKEVVLLFSDEQRKQFEIWLKIVAKEKGTEGVSETCYEGLRVAAEHLNQ